jgi:hypothetical protein
LGCGAEAVSKLFRQPIILPLLREVEERAGERRRVFIGIPLSSVLSPLVPRGARKRYKQVLRQSQHRSPTIFEKYGEISAGCGGAGADLLM